MVIAKELNDPAVIGRIAELLNMNEYAIAKAQARYLRGRLRIAMPKILA
jgi:hypothetical protein